MCREKRKKIFDEYLKIKNKYARVRAVLEEDRSVRFNKRIYYALVA